MLQMPVPDAQPATRSLQVKMDAVVERCQAATYVKLTAMSPGSVVIYLINNIPPTDSDTKVFGCVLDQMKLMKNIDFGLIGNEKVEPDR